MTGAYDAASGTVLAISFMMSGFPTTRRRMLGPCPPRSFRKTSPESKRTNSIRPEVPIAVVTTRSRSPRVVAEATARWNSGMSGRPMLDVSVFITSSNGLRETILTLRTCTSIVCIFIPPCFFVHAT